MEKILEVIFRALKSPPIRAVGMCLECRFVEFKRLNNIDLCMKGFLLSVILYLQHPKYILVRPCLRYIHVLSRDPHDQMCPLRFCQNICYSFICCGCEEYFYIQKY